MSSSTMLIYLAKYQPEVNQYHYKQKKALLLPTAYQKTDSNCPHFTLSDLNNQETSFQIW